MWMETEDRRTKNRLYEENNAKNECADDENVSTIQKEIVDAAG